MNWDEYHAKFEDILQGEILSAPYDNPTYFEYVKLNNSRSNRWLKKSTLLDETKAVLKSLKSTQKWYLITEPWCGDAAHLAPFIYKMAEHSPHIKLHVIHRDGDNKMIDLYLTNESKSIPKLIVRDQNNIDLFVWGPRPIEAHKLVQSQKSSQKTTQEKKAELQVWYNKNKGVAIQNELTALIKQF